MTDAQALNKKCSRCGAAIERCAFCDEPDCPAAACYKCVRLAFLDRVVPRPTTPSPARS